MKQCPSWKANILTARQGVNRILWDPKVHNRVQNIPPHVHILSQINPAQALTNNIFKINFNIIPPSKTYLPRGLFPSGFPT